ncbi:ABC transporter substrate-binding protein [Sphaerotilus mobilis]|uniref:Amino acid/amide ABC transporter substrate-binding protein (HAAT family) n=1 Tax=Sphaerotilus mobilis TaxID=47994 RepID=A0A4Q7LQ29_9BURK|nr:ABC transporter substrate-binding protein [Sphaerotilus mobilis]RZS56905.1 amino acid/amide ABC transporter substrate-binding protein (HAAT family) [Sphaerotilus mobilis]
MHPSTQRRAGLQAAVAVAAASLFALPALAADVVKIATLVELSGAGATSGTNFKNGIELAVREINAAGGILGRKIETSTSDTQSNPGVAKGLAQKAVDDEVFAVFGPVFSGSIMVSMAETRRAEVPNFTGGEAAAITKQGNPYIFRTSFTQDTAMPKVARYIAQNLKAKTVALIYVNNDYGKGGRESLMAALEPLGVKVIADLSTEQAQIDFSAPVLKAKQANADVVFVYTNEEESARALRELRKQGVTKPIVGETTLVGQKVIELAGEAANGAVAHVGLTVDAPSPAMKAFNAKFQKEYKYVTDHNGIKGYTGIYILKAAIEKVGKFDRKAVAAALHGLTISAAKEPGVIMDVSIDANGDLDRESFLVEARNGGQIVKEVLPALGRR